MRRRDLFCMVGGIAVASQPLAYAQRVYRLGYLSAPNRNPFNVRSTFFCGGCGNLVGSKDQISKLNIAGPKVMLHDFRSSLRNSCG